MAKMAAITGAMRKRDGREVISPKLGRCNDGMGFVSWVPAHGLAHGAGIRFVS
ncbi:hypothetical protein D3C86_2197680 [compost metagenome]